MVHVPSGHKKEVDHQVECKLKACVSRLEENSQQHRLRILNKLLKMLEPLSANCPVHDPVVTRHRDPHHAGHGGLAVRPRHHLLLGAAHGQDVLVVLAEELEHAVAAPATRESLSGRTRRSGWC